MSQFVDSVTVTVRSGDGGNGIVSFRRERFVEFGGPDGGDGGDGGSIILAVSPHLDTLRHLNFKRFHTAENGTNGGKSNRHGKNGADCVIAVPAGTVVSDLHTQKMLCDITDTTAVVTLLSGGKGGYGNAKFKTAHNRAPKFAQSGKAGETREITLTLQLIADVALVGFPNAGKSTLLRALTAARPQVAAYPFTSLHPTLGVLADNTWHTQQVTLVDIPGIIQGAAHGAGLGLRFLQHVQRVRLIALVVSLPPLQSLSALGQIQHISAEIKQYDASLLHKIDCVIANKQDISGMRSVFDDLQRNAQIGAKKIFSCSAKTGDGLAPIKAYLLQAVRRAHASSAR